MPPKYKVGQLVVNRKLGLGKVLGISGDEVLAFFKDEESNPRTINVARVPMDIPSEQSDPFFDSMDDAKLARLSKKTKPRKPRAPKAPKVAKVVEAV